MATTIWDEVIDGNIAGVRKLLENVNVRNGLGETPLHLAARHGLEEMTEVSGTLHARSHLAVSFCREDSRRKRSKYAWNQTHIQVNKYCRSRVT